MYTTRKQVQGMRAPMARASRCRARAHPGFSLGATSEFALHWQDKNTAMNAQQGKAQVRAHRGYAVEAPGEWYLSRRAPRSLRPWLQSVLARAILDQLRLLKVGENGPHGRTRMGSQVSFDNATWHGYTVPRMHH